MKLLGRIFLALGAFLLATGIVYGLHSRDYQAFTLIVTTAGGAFLIGGYLAQAMQRAASRPTIEPVPGPGEGEPHVGPTIWPLVFALSMVPLVIGALGSRWVLIVGGAVFLLAGVGWLRDVQRQWAAHYGGAHHQPAGGRHTAGG